MTRRMSLGGSLLGALFAVGSMGCPDMMVTGSETYCAVRDAHGHCESMGTRNTYGPRGGSERSFGSSDIARPPKVREPPKLPEVAFQGNYPPPDLVTLSSLIYQEIRSDAVMALLPRLGHPDDVTGRSYWFSGFEGGPGLMVTLGDENDSIYSITVYHEYLGKPPFGLSFFSTRRRQVESILGPTENEVTSDYTDNYRSKHGFEVNYDDKGLDAYILTIEIRAAIH